MFHMPYISQIHKMYYGPTKVLKIYWCTFIAVWSSTFFRPLMWPYSVWFLWEQEYSSFQRWQHKWQWATI